MASFMIVTASVRNILDTPSYTESEPLMESFAKQNTTLITSTFSDQVTCRYRRDHQTWQQ
jgi:hypothetical protein